MDPWLPCTRSWGLHERGMPGTVFPREAGAALSGGGGLQGRLLPSPPLSILPLRDSHMGE